MNLKSSVVPWALHLDFYLAVKIEGTLTVFAVPNSRLVASSSRYNSIDCLQQYLSLMTAISVLSMLLRLQPVDKVHYVILQPLLVVIHIDPLDRRPQPPPSFSDNGPPNARYNLKHATEPASINNSLFCFIPKKRTFV